MQLPGESYCRSMTLHKASGLLLARYFVIDWAMSVTFINNYLLWLILFQTGQFGKYKFYEHKNKLWSMQQNLGL
jgi:hypothetical protein